MRRYVPLHQSFVPQPTKYPANVVSGTGAEEHNAHVTQSTKQVSESNSISRAKLPDPVPPPDQPTPPAERVRARSIEVAPRFDPEPVAVVSVWIGVI